MYLSRQLPIPVFLHIHMYMYMCRLDVHMNMEKGIYEYYIYMFITHGCVYVRMHACTFAHFHLRVCMYVRTYIICLSVST